MIRFNHFAEAYFMTFNDLHKVIINSHVYHFADDTNLLLIDISPKKINKLINQDLSKLWKQLWANKIFLNSSKTKIILFKTKTKNVPKKFNFRVSGEKINLTEQVKYLGLLISNTLTWDSYQNSLINKLKRAIGLLAKIRHYIPKFLLKSIYYSIFNSHLIYACQIWGQKNNSEKLHQLSKLEDKALRITHFLSPQ